MPIYRGVHLEDYISRLAGIAQPLKANIYQTWPSLAVGTNITIGTGAEVYGSWVEFISAASAPNVPFTISHIINYNTEGRDMTFQIGIGSAGSETPAATSSGIGYGYNVGWDITTPTRFPYIPGGTRVALRVRSDYALGGITVTPKIISCRLPPTMDPALMLKMAPKVSKFYPGDGPSFHGSGLPASGAWNYGSYSQILGTGETQPFILTGIAHWPTSTAARYVAVQSALAWGGAGSETVFAEYAFQSYYGYPTVYVKGMEWLPLPFPVIIPPSTRLAQKSASDVGWDGTNGSYINGSVYDVFRGGIYP